MPNPAFKIGMSRNKSWHELHFHLYLHQSGAGSNQNITEVVHTKHPKGFGSIKVNDWTIYDGLGRDAKLVGRGQGIHCKASMESGGWHNSFSMVFEDASGFKGSTLQVMGHNVTERDAAIVGGTGEFTLARGVIYKKVKEQRGDVTVVELDIHALYWPFKPQGSGEYAWNL